MGDSGDFAGRVALVTGGTRGIGAAISQALVERGARVHAVYRSDARSADELAARVGSALTTICADLVEERAADDVVARILRDSRRLDVLVNNAGNSDDRLLLRTTPSHFRAALSLNLEALSRVTRAALAPMLKQRYGRIVSLSSVVAAMGNTGQTGYAAAKAGVEGFTRSLAKEVAQRGITVNCVAPGWISTDMTAGVNDSARKRALELTPMGRAGTPEEVAHAVAFLASQEAAYITGTVLQVSGGMYM